MNQNINTISKITELCEQINNLMSSMSQEFISDNSKNEASNNWLLHNSQILDKYNKSYEIINKTLLQLKLRKDEMQTTLNMQVKQAEQILQKVKQAVDSSKKSWSQVAVDPPIRILKRPVVVDASSQVEIAPGVMINAKHVKTVNDIPNSYLYVLPNNRFAVKINGICLSGNIGEIFESHEKPINFTECWGRERCKGNGIPNNCPHYHDPNIHPTSKDIRNFTNRMQYVKSRDNVDKGCYYRAGSRSNLKEDLAYIEYGEGKKMIDMGVSFFLTALKIAEVLNKRAVNEKC